jgi:hypothetical protein
VLEADPNAAPDDIYDMMDDYLNDQNLPRSLVNITLATLTFKFAPVANSRGSTLTFDVSFPNSSNLKSKREEHRVIAEKYLRHWGIDRA